MSGENPREIAARVLSRRENGPFVEQLLDEAMAGSHLSQPDRRLCQELVYGVVRWQATLDWLIARKTQDRPQKKALQNLLRLGLYQVFWLDRIPDHAAVHQTVALARRSGFGPQAGFVNALLRGYLREAEPTRKALEALKTQQPWLGHSHPEWLARRWQSLWGATGAAALMTWNNMPARTFARLNTLKTDPGSLLTQWREENVAYDFVRRDWFDDNLVFELVSHPPLHRLASFRQGLFYVQDPSTLLAVRELAPQPSEAVLDFCAAPGGKLTYIAQLMRNDGRLVAHDTDAERLQLLVENCSRLGVTCAELRCSPSGGEVAQEPAVQDKTPNEPARFDRILIDAPCSNTGVIRRRIDLRWRLRAEELERLCQVQLALLGQAAPLLKTGGMLVYSTCSLEPEENAAVAQRFLELHPQFVCRSQRELIPFVDGVDGAYVARFERQL